MKISQSGIAIVVAGLLCGHNAFASLDHEQLHALGNRLCQVFATTAGDQLTDQIIRSATEQLGGQLSTQSENIEFRGRAVGTRVSIETPQPVAASLSVQLITPPMRAPRTVLTLYRENSTDSPQVQFVYTDNCQLQQAWQQVFSEQGQALYSQQLAPDDFSARGEQLWLNPPLPTLTPVTPPRLRVGLIDSGVNYQLQRIANALARDQQGQLIGYDFWDMDAQPFDAHPTQSPFVIQRHGTRTASIVIDEAPGVAIVPYRYPRPDMTRMKDLIEHAAKHNVRIIGMPLGGNRHQEWAAFQRAAEAHPNILFIASAGNNGRDIDRRGVYPASLEIDNMLVVTSSNDFVKPADRTNFGRLSVDYLLPAENISALDFDGTTQRVSGSSYAVSRMVALAARLLNRTPTLTTSELMQAIEKLSIRGNSGRYVSTGYLGDLFATGTTVSTTAIDAPAITPKDSRYTLPLDVFLLGKKWQTSTIVAAIDNANDILQQCDIRVEPQQWWSVDAPDYLRNLSTSNALTLRQKLPDYKLAVFFANDTNMYPGFDAEAFGTGNSRNRPWLENTLWITTVTKDLSIALAHELFHIVVNNGRHSIEKNNLMRDRTSKQNTRLTTEQCNAAISYSLESGLLR
ncbi:MAG: S8/S53 family peptidase [Pseudomonadota bacterium]